MSEGYGIELPFPAAKSGLHDLSRTLAIELGPANILSNVVMPAMVLTEAVRERVPDEHMNQVKEHTQTRRVTTSEDVAADRLSRLAGEPASPARSSG